MKARSTAASIQEQDHPGWDADWARLRFIALLVCDNKDCQEVATLAGRGHIELVQYEHSQYHYVEFFTPEFFKPSPNLINIPKECSEEVREELQAAFVASWGDPSAAANHIRTAVERLLDQAKQPKTRLNSKGKRGRLSLHKRIEDLAKRDKTLSESLLAVKWLGNAGSHTDTLTQDSIYDALDILERAIDALFSKNGLAIRRLVKKINAQKGPPK